MKTIMFNPGEGSPETQEQMRIVIAIRNLEAIRGFIQGVIDTSLRGNPVKCTCGYDMVEIAIHEIAELHVCPNCSRVIEHSPDFLKVLYEGSA